MNSITVFTHEMFGEIRVTDNNGEPWFIAKDIADRLGYAQTKNMMYHVDDEDKSLILPTFENNETPTKVTIINESGLYAAIIGSKLESAKQFKRWVCKEVLPAIRKTGSYSVQQLPDFNNPVAMARAWADRLESEQLALQQAQVAQHALEVAQPHIERSTRFLSSTKDCSIGEFSKVYNHQGLGQNKLFALLRDEKVLQSKGFQRNLPYQTYIDRGYFRVIETVNCNGVFSKTLITTKGFDWLVKLLDKKVK